MKTAYFFISPIGLIRLLEIILPELEAGTHSLDVVAMCFFDTNSSILDIHHSIGSRLSKLGRKQNITLMQSNSATSESYLNYKSEYNAVIKQVIQKATDHMVITIADGEQVGCFPDFYAAVGENRPERLMSF